jgi:ABC-type cobalt transport system substrate-binding protein
MRRLIRIVVITVAVFIIAWVVKEIIAGGDGKKAEDLIQKIRLSGI